MRVNLLPEEFRQTASLKRTWMAHLGPRALWIFFGVLCAADLLLFAASATLLSPRQSLMQQKYLELGPNLKEVRGIKAEASRLQEQSRLLAAATTRRFAWSRLLEEISKELPDSVWLESLRMERLETFEKPAKKTNSSAAKKGGADKELMKKSAPSKEKKGTAKSDKSETPQKPKEAAASVKSVRLMLTGRAGGEGRQTAAVSEYVRRLKSAQVFSAVAGDWKVESIRGVEEEKTDTAAEVYIFTIATSFKDSESHSLWPNAVKKEGKSR